MNVGSRSLLILWHIFTLSILSLQGNLMSVQNTSNFDDSKSITKLHDTLVSNSLQEDWIDGNPHLYNESNVHLEVQRNYPETQLNEVKLFTEDNYYKLNYSNERANLDEEIYKTNIIETKYKKPVEANSTINLGNIDINNTTGAGPGILASNASDMLLNLIKQSETQSNEEIRSKNNRHTVIKDDSSFSTTVNETKSTNIYLHQDRKQTQEKHSHNYGVKRKVRQKRGRDKSRRNNLSLWIDEQQVRMFSGYPMEIYVIVEGRIMPYILDPDFESQLPIIPSEVKTVNFTWKSGEKKYFYHFDLMKSFDANILQHPYVSIRRKGRIPKKPKSFTVHIPCAGNVSGVATFAIGLLIRNTKNEPLPDTPIHLRLRKKCEISGDQNSSCDEECANGGICDAKKTCLCPEGYMGKLCQTALCYPQCRNGGTCSSPGRCSCLQGYHGRYCEGGICSQRCLNGGKCIQKDTCACQKGYYGNRCEFSKCIIPCVNGGKCQGVNKCRCKSGYSGNHCEIITARGLTLLLRRCSGKCRHGTCVEHGKCQCLDGFTGRWCRKRISRKKTKSNGKKKLWV